MGFCDLPLADKLCAVGDAVDFASDPGTAIGNWMAKSSGELAAAAVDLAAEAVDTTTSVDLNAGWFRDNYELILPIGLVVLVATFSAQLVRAAIRRDGQALTQAFTGTAVGVLFAFTAIAFTTVAVEVVDALSAGLLKAAHVDIATAVRRLVKVGQLASLSGLGWLVTVVAGFGTALAAFLYWGVMMLRKVGILIMVTLAVFAGAGGGWEVARRWRQGWIEGTAALVASKLLMTVIFVLGLAAQGKTDATGGIAALADVLAGLVILALVLLCPYATFKFVHWAAAQTDAEALHRSAGAGAQVARQHAERVGRKAAATAAGAGAGSAVGSGGAPQGPETVPGAFPGDIAAHPTPGTGRSITPTAAVGSGAGIKKTLDKAVRPPPTSPRDDTSGQIGGASGQGSGPGSPSSGSGFMSQPGTGTSAPPPQGDPPASGPATAAEPGTPPPPPTGP
ncbi:type IV secretion system protein [Streptomyces sp. SID13726]|uniref:SCO6881 family protein n=1 Tax=Streptomyces sp. SID13726 TaxID=2706058 RepID=UPI0013B69F0A|nr:type IV secretion system protein [Streptomyces sp. SID13726]NEB01960.1 type IV secretion system protein [Streptomyces sp. SID13726]